MIDSITPDLKKKINSVSDNTARVQMLKDAYAGVDTAYVFTCGTSLRDNWSEELKQFLKGKMVIAVKQGIDIFDHNDVDIHVYNKIRVNPEWEQELKDSDTIRCCDYRPCVGNPDIYFPYALPPKDIDGEMHEWGFVKKSYHENAKDYDKWDLNNGVLRPWGYGIVSSTVSFMPPYMGIKNTVIFGWDLVGGWFYHNEGSHKIMNGRDSTMTKDTIPNMLALYEKYGCKVSLCSEISNLPIPRISLEEVMNP